MSSWLSACVQSSLSRQIGLLALRVTLGGLLVWWGLAKVVQPGLGLAISDTFYGGVLGHEAMIVAFGVVQALLGSAVVLGIFRILTFAAAFAMNAFTAAAVWYALVDPFKWWLPPQSDFPFTQLFYPSAIIVAASWILIAFHRDDRWTIAHARISGTGRRSPARPSGPDPAATRRRLDSLH